MANNAAFFRFLDRFQDQLRKAPRNVLRDVSRQLAEETLDRVKDGFRREANPYGEPWDEKKVPDGRKVLSGKTGRLKQYHVKALSDTSFTVGPIVDYGRYHQSGIRRMPARKMVPESPRGLPKDWERDFEEIVADVLDEHFTPKR